MNRISVISCSTGTVSPSQASFESLLDQLSNDGASQTRLQPQDGCSLLLITVPTTERSPNTIKDAANLLDASLRTSPFTTTICTFTVSSRDGVNRSISAVLCPECTQFTLPHPDLDTWDSESSSTQVSLLEKAKSTLRWHSQTHRPGWFSKFRNLFIPAILLTLLLSSALYLSFSTNPDDTLIQYDVGASLGPHYTSLLTPDNVTAWAEKHYHGNEGAWTIRLDDQALVPTSLMDEQELRYQSYLAQRYPEKAEIASSGAWHDLDFLAEPNNYMVPTDQEFHTGHCLRAFRRYWQAKETGRHVCPWDIDYLHLKHCFNMLEGWMLPAGERDKRPGNTLSMSWRTKVCMFEP